MNQELRDGDHVYGWWAVLTDDGTNLLVCLLKRCNRWNFLFRFDNRDPSSRGVHSWVMQPALGDPLTLLHARLEEALDVIFLEAQCRRQVFVEVRSDNIERMVRGLQVIHELGFPIRAEDLARGA